MPVAATRSAPTTDLIADAVRLYGHSPGFHLEIFPCLSVDSVVIIHYVNFRVVLWQIYSRTRSAPTIYLFADAVRSYGPLFMARYPISVR